MCILLYLHTIYSIITAVIYVSYSNDKWDDNTHTAMIPRAAAAAWYFLVSSVMMHIGTRYQALLYTRYVPGTAVTAVDKWLRITKSPAIYNIQQQLLCGAAL